MPLKNPILFVVCIFTAVISSCLFTINTFFQMIPIWGESIGIAIGIFNLVICSVSWAIIGAILFGKK